ncbi:hypothetical protein [Streptomyces sp. NPDC056672]|uniref:hypothetical protein n=1 Tax=Streptomyces sp. NPDC056672 TaxID=3345906 RepID=UPI00368FD11C
MSDHQHQATADIQVGQPLPGTKILGTPLPGWYEGPPFPHVVLPDMTIHVQYRQVIERGGEWPAHESLGYGQPQVRGQGVRNFLRGSLRGWLFSEATVTDDDVIRYRHSDQHSAIRLEPDPEAGILIEHPERHVTAPAYRVTGPEGSAHLWSRRAMLAAVKHCTHEKPVGWPDGWANLKPTGAIHLSSGGAPGARIVREWTAQPEHQAGNLGQPCADCGYHQTDHTTSGQECWFRHRRDRSGCTEWTAEPTR